MSLWVCVHDISGACQFGWAATGKSAVFLMITKRLSCALSMPRGPSCGTSAENRALIVCRCNPTQWQGAQIKGCGAAQSQWATTKTLQGQLGLQFTVRCSGKVYKNNFEFIFPLKSKSEWALQSFCFGNNDHIVEYVQYTYNPERGCLCTSWRLHCKVTYDEWPEI